MDADSRLEAQRRALTASLRRADLTLEQLWIRYFSLGGEVGLTEVEAYLHGMMPLPADQCDVLAHAVNERLDELTWPHRVPYNHPDDDTGPSSGPLAALVGLLDGAYLAPPERLPAVVEVACRAAGLGVEVYLVDHGQRFLVPLPGPGGGYRQPLGVDTTVPGMVFRSVRTASSEKRGKRTLWLPLLDGVERLGVVGFTPSDPADADDRTLRAQCRWIAALIGYLVAAMARYGDGLDAVRRDGPSSAAAGLVRGLLPPSTAGVGSFVLSGLVETGSDGGGDAFDYALSETTGALAIFDAAGGTTADGFVAAAALAGYRGARHVGESLVEQAAAVDRAIADRFPGGAAATGVLAELDVTSGRLRYLNAGHPEPLLLRSGKVIRSLIGGHRVPFGQRPGSFAVAEDVLRPGDWVVLHTDGVTEARDDRGEWFGEARLVDLLEREAEAGRSPPEAVRRLVRAVVRHRKGELRDDATVLLARWARPDDAAL
ncbi:PP2C family protein-serine/threonine phosphatase [Umezawaea endophytica]|uniref:Serine/threonine-protein phosphatase n=1 Tax=Umezawaea endophytica TaxID=1654476 RepID=A0A9X2VG00_9PSEU|nr:PP2C family protein-serine/threonine phosphatase [Umezawaea endophytica]MCS7475910.1 serine/threonine-protein phosphatase [Umezawaea endophytica]